MASKAASAVGSNSPPCLKDRPVTRLSAAIASTAAEQQAKDKETIKELRQQLAESRAQLVEKDRQLSESQLNVQTLTKQLEQSQAELEVIKAASVKLPPSPAAQVLPAAIDGSADAISTTPWTQVVRSGRGSAQKQQQQQAPAAGPLQTALFNDSPQQAEYNKSLVLSTGGVAQASHFKVTGVYCTSGKLQQTPGGTDSTRCEEVRELVQHVAEMPAASIMHVRLLRGGKACVTFANTMQCRQAMAALRRMAIDLAGKLPHDARAQCGVWVDQHLTPLRHGIKMALMPTHKQLQRQRREAGALHTGVRFNGHVLEVRDAATRRWVEYRGPYFKAPVGNDAWEGPVPQPIMALVIKGL